MRALAEARPEESIVQQFIAQLSWCHNVRVLDRIKDRPTREWCLPAALEHGWSQEILVIQIKSGLREMEGKALTNFQRALPPPDSDLAEQILNRIGVFSSELRLQSAPILSSQKSATVCSNRQELALARGRRLLFN